MGLEHVYIDATKSRLLFLGKLQVSFRFFFLRREPVRILRGTGTYIARSLVALCDPTQRVIVSIHAWRYYMSHVGAHCIDYTF